MLRIIKFVLDTADMGLKLVPTFTKGHLEWRLVGAIDSDWANDNEGQQKIRYGFHLVLVWDPHSMAF